MHARVLGEQGRRGRGRRGEVWAGWQCAYKQGGVEFVGRGCGRRRVTGIQRVEHVARRCTAREHVVGRCAAREHVVGRCTIKEHVEREMHRVGS
eukprot:351571-Chlamydomonas_euryale.AAC.9